MTQTSNLSPSQCLGRRLGTIINATVPTRVLVGRKPSCSRPKFIISYPKLIAVPLTDPPLRLRAPP